VLDVFVVAVFNKGFGRFNFLGRGAGVVGGIFRVCESVGWFIILDEPDILIFNVELRDITAWLGKIKFGLLVCCLGEIGLRGSGPLFFHL
jgi:hypothetical protein